MKVDKELEEKILNLLEKYYISQKSEDNSQSISSYLSLIILQVMIKYFKFKFDVKAHATKVKEFIVNFASIVFMSVGNFWNFLWIKQNNDLDKKMIEKITKMDQKITKLESNLEEKLLNITDKITTMEGSLNRYESNFSNMIHKLNGILANQKQNRVYYD